MKTVNDGAEGGIRWGHSQRVPSIHAHDAVHGPSLMKWWLLEQLNQKDLQNPRIRKLGFVKIGFYDPDWVDR